MIQQKTTHAIQHDIEHVTFFRHVFMRLEPWITEATTLTLHQAQSNGWHPPLPTPLQGKVAKGTDVIVVTAPHTIAIYTQTGLDGLDLMLKSLDPLEDAVSLLSSLHGFQCQREGALVRITVTQGKDTHHFWIAANNAKVWGDILWFVMLVLMVLAMSAMQLSGMQHQALRVAQWHDIAWRTEWAVDDALMRYAYAPSQFPGPTTPDMGSSYWLHASLGQWRAFPSAVHEITAWGTEVHVIMEAISSEPEIFRVNALGYHPSGTLLRKQWVMACTLEHCQQMSSHAV